jgi:hypothetical protein
MKSSTTWQTPEINRPIRKWIFVILVFIVTGYQVSHSHSDASHPSVPLPMNHFIRIMIIPQIIYTKIGHCTQYSKKFYHILFSTFLPPTCYHRTLVLVHSLLILFLSLSICQFLRRLSWRASLLLHIHQRHLDCPSFFVAERWL